MKSNKTLYMFIIGNIGLVLSSLFKLNGDVNFEIAMRIALLFYFFSIFLIIYKELDRFIHFLKK